MLQTSMSIFLFLIIFSFMPNGSEQADQYSINYNGCQPTQPMKGFDMNRVRNFSVKFL